MMLRPRLRDFKPGTVYRLGKQRITVLGHGSKKTRFGTHWTIQWSDGRKQWESALSHFAFRVRRAQVEKPFTLKPPPAEPPAPAVEEPPPPVLELSTGRDELPGQLDMWGAA